MFNKTLHLLLIFLVLVISLAACGRTSVDTGDTPTSPATALPQTVYPTVPNIRPTASEPVQGNASQTLELAPVSGEYLFAEGPAADANGNIYFSDINAGKVYQWSPDGSVTVFAAGLKGPNGLAFDESGNLIACEGGNGRLISLDPQGQITVLADQYNGIRFNEPNDLWIDPQGGIYFTDPAYQSSVVQDGEHVYYLSPDRSQTIRVISDMTKPNGIVGTADGKTLYVADHGAGQTFAYTVNSDGTLSNKRLFAASGSDGMELDADGNLYLTVLNQVEIFAASGEVLREIPTPENPTNVTFGGADGQTLFITARTAVYTVQMSTGSAVMEAITADFTLTSPDLPADGRLPVEYTCDGAASTLALDWSGASAGTQSFAVVMHHVAGPDDVHWYWFLYDIPASVTSLSKNSLGVGTLGNNSVNGRLEYAPPCSKGPGDKEYIYTVYALSASPQISVSADKVDRAALLAAIQDITLASAELYVVYARP